MRLRLLVHLLASLLVVIGLVYDVSAQNLVGRPTRTIMGLKIGLITRMDLKADPNLQSEVGSNFGMFADFPKGKENYLSVALDFYYIEITRENQVMVEGSLAYKHGFVLQHLDVVLKPGFAIGYAYLADIGYLSASSYFTTKLIFEAHFKISARKAWVGELSIWHAPVGSNEDEELVFGPGILFRVGLAFR